MGIIHSMPTKWDLTNKTATNAPVIEPVPFANSPAILITENLVAILDASSKPTSTGYSWRKNKRLLVLKKSYRRGTPTWLLTGKVFSYSSSFHTTLESKLRKFQFKILGRIILTNEQLFRFGIVESPVCAFCQTEVESVEHVLFSCRVSSKFWKHVLSRLRDNNICVENLKEADLIFGKFVVRED